MLLKSVKGLVFGGERRHKSPATGLISWFLDRRLTNAYRRDGACRDPAVNGLGLRAARAGSTGNAPAAAAPSSTPPGGAAQPAPAQRGTAPTAAAPGNAGQFKTEADAKSHCPTGDVVWMNLDSHVYHLSGAKEYGHTKHGAYMCQADADKAGRAAKDEKPKKKS